MTDLPNPFSNSGATPSGGPDEAAALTRSHAPGAAAEIPVSPGAIFRSLPSGESEPSVMLACAPGESSSCSGVEMQTREVEVDLKTSRRASPVASRKPELTGIRPAGVAPGLQDIISDREISLSELIDRGFDTEKFLFAIGCVPDDFAKYMAMMEGLVDHDEPPLFIQEQMRA